MRNVFSGGLIGMLGIVVDDFVVAGCWDTCREGKKNGRWRWTEPGWMDRANFMRCLSSLCMLGWAMVPIVFFCFLSLPGGPLYLFNFFVSEKVSYKMYAAGLGHDRHSTRAFSHAVWDMCLDVLLQIYCRKCECIAARVLPTIGDRGKPAESSKDPKSIKTRGRLVRGRWMSLPKLPTRRDVVTPVEG